MSHVTICEIFMAKMCDFWCRWGNLLVPRHAKFDADRWQRRCTGRKIQRTTANLLSDKTHASKQSVMSIVQHFCDACHYLPVTLMFEQAGAAVWRRRRWTNSPFSKLWLILWNCVVGEWSRRWVDTTWCLCEWLRQDIDLCTMKWTIDIELDERNESSHVLCRCFVSVRRPTPWSS